MKKYSLLALMAILVIPMALSRPAFANAENQKEHIQTMREAAKELKATNPVLAEKLEKFSKDKEEWKENKKDDREKMIKQKKEDLETLRLASVQLKNTGNDQDKNAANKLEDIAERWQKKLDEKSSKN